MTKNQICRKGIWVVTAVFIVVVCNLELASGQQVSASGQQVSDKHLSQLEGTMKLMGVKKVGSILSPDGKSYPWITLGKTSWIFDANGGLQRCPECATWGGGLRRPPQQNNNTYNFPFRCPVNKVSASSNKKTEEACKSLYYEGSVKSPWVECP